MQTKNKTADLIHSLMIQSTDSKPVSQTSLKVMKTIQNDSVENQILGVTSLLLVLLDRYGLNHIDVLGMADAVVYSGDYNNMLPEFKNIINLMKNKKEILS